MSPFSYPKDRIKVVLLEGVHERAEQSFREAGYSQVQRLSHALNSSELADVLSQAHMVGIRSRTQLTQEVLADARRLMAVGCFCIGTNQVDVLAAAKAGVPVFNAPHSNTRSVAELVIGWIIMLMRDVFPRSQAAHLGEWQKTASGSNEVRGKTLGIVGYGHIGSQVSVLAEAMGMQVLYYDIESKLPLGNARGVPDLESLLKASDVVTLHVPGTDNTKWMIDEQRIASMRPGSYLINASRGTVVAIDALAAALRSGHIKGTAIDVYPTEPRSNDDVFESPLRGIPQAILTPHIGGSTLEAQVNIGFEVASKLVQYSDFGSTQGAVNFPQLTLSSHPDAHRILHIHRNVPGVLKQITQVIAEENINIVGQHLQTDANIGYVVLDVEGQAPVQLLDSLKDINATIRARILY